MKLLPLSLLLLLSALLFPSCLWESDPKEEPNYECTNDEECAHKGQLCAPNRTCMELRDPLELPLGIEVYDKRKGSSTRGKLLFDVGPRGLVPGEDGVVHVTLPEPTTMTVQVNTLKGMTEGNLVSYRLSAIPGKDVVTAVTDLGVVSNAPVREYELKVRQKGDYLLQVIPFETASYSPMISYFTLTEDRTEPFELGHTNYRVRGRVRDSDGLPVLGAQVFAFDWETGAASTVAEVTQDATGAFELLFSDIPLSLSIYVVPTEHVSVFPADKFTVTQNDLARGTVHLEGIPTIEVGELVLQATPGPITFETQVYGYTHSGTKENVAGAKVTFRAEVKKGSQQGRIDPSANSTTDGTGVILVEGVTDADGWAVVELIPGEHALNRVYEVTVVTPVDSPFASIRKDILVGSTGGIGEPIELENRIDVVGQITGPQEGEPLRTVLVSATVSSNAQELNPEIMVDPDYMQTAQSDADGWFSLRLDPGYYDFSLMYPSAYWFPYSTYTDQVVFPSKTDNNFTFTPAKPAMVRIVVQDAQGNPLPDMEIRAYSVDEACNLNHVTCDYPARLLSTSTTNNQGLATLLVPAEGE